MDWSRFNPRPDPETVKKKFTGDDWSRFKPTPSPSPSPTRRAPKQAPPAIELRPAGPVHDGDTYRSQGGHNVRLGSVDAFELGQPGRDAQGSRYPLGVLSRNSLAQFATPDATARSTGTESYGRPVVNLSVNGRDVGGDMVSRGMAIPDPRFIPENQLGDYVELQRGAIASEAGAYGGQYQFPWDYRAQGGRAAWRGRAPMDPETAASWEALIRDPKTKREDVERWLAERGQKAENIDNIMSLMRQNRAAQPRPIFQQEDVQGKPVAPAQPFWKRQVAAVAEGVPDVLGIPAEALQQTPGLFGPTGTMAKMAIDRTGISLPDSATREGDNVVFRWKPKPERRALPAGFEGRVRAREGTGPMGNDEVGTFADSSDKPKTGFRFEPAQEREIGDALLAGDGRRAMELARKYGGALDPAGVAQTVAFVRKQRARGITPRFGKGQSPVNYAAVDRLVKEDEAAKTEASQPAFGTEDIRTFMHGVPKVGQLDESYAPQSTGERYLQAIERSIPSAVGGAAGVRATVGNLTRQSLATTVGGSAGSYIGAQAADDVAPGNQLVAFAAQMVGGGLVGGASHKLTSPRTRTPVIAATEAITEPQLPARLPMEADTPPSPSISAAIEQPVKGPGGRNAVTAETADALSTVTPDDVLPVTLGDNPPTMAGRIKLENLESPQDIRQALDTVAQRAGGFDEARRGKITQEATSALAEELGMTARELLGRRKGEAFNAEQALAARQILAKSANEIVNDARRLSGRIADGTASDADLVAFRQKLNAHAAIQQEVTGMTAEAGRTLSQFRIPADSRMVRGDVLRSLIDRDGGISDLGKVAEAIIANADDPKRLNQLTRAIASPTLKDKMIAVWYFNLLSRPSTHLANITSNAITAAGQIPENLTAAAIGSVRRVSPRNSAVMDRMTFGEVGQRILGMGQGAAEGLREAGRVLRTGETKDPLTKMENNQQPAFKGVFGTLVDAPTRALNAEDTFFKAIAARSETVGLAVRKARMEGLKGEARQQRIAELVANPTDEMMKQAFDFARYQTFQRPLGELGQTGQRFLNRAWPLKAFIPFTRTPTNLLKYFGERSPLAPLSSKWRADFKAGGARRDLAIARLTLGSGAMYLAAQAAQDGWITGNGPTDEKQRNAMIADGWQPYSIYNPIDGKYYSYRRLDPMATTLGLAADYVDVQRHMTAKERDQTAALLGMAAMENLGNKTWISGMSDFTEAISDPQRNIPNIVGRFVATATVPGILAETAQAVDPVSRDARGFIDRIKARIPSVSSSLPARRDVFGNEIPSGSGGGIGALSPMTTRPRRNDPLAKALYGAGVGIGSPRRGDLTPQQFEQLQVRAANIFRPELLELVDSLDWQELDTEGRQSEVDRIVARARREAKRDILLGEPEGAAPGAPKPGKPDPWARFKPQAAP